MQLKRVVITGVGAVSPLGNDVASLINGIEQGKSAVKYMEGWDQFIGLRSLVAAPVELKNHNLIPRQSRRSMGRMSIFAVQATEQALHDSNIERQNLSSGRVGCVIGSTIGGSESLYETYEILLPEKNFTKLTAMKFFQCISHTAAMNVAQYFELTGYVLATSAACASALQAIGAGYDLIRLGKQDIMLCGGAEELHPTVTGSFDVLNAASYSYNKNPQETPRPFDLNRDGLVCGEGCGMVVLEEYEHAVARNAKIYAEIQGYHTCGSGRHVSQSDKDAIVLCLKEALKSADIKPEETDYVNAHATATVQGDKEEAEAIKEVFGENVPVSSLKGYMGHTLGASGSLELIATLEMMKKGIIYPTLNLKNISEDCKGINHVMKTQSKKLDIIVKDCFAFGGIKAVIILKKIN